MSRACQLQVMPTTEPQCGRPAPQAPILSVLYRCMHDVLQNAPCSLTARVASPMRRPSLYIWGQLLVRWVLFCELLEGAEKVNHLYATSGHRVQTRLALAGRPPATGCSHPRKIAHRTQSAAIPTTTHFRCLASVDIPSGEGGTSRRSARGCRDKHHKPGENQATGGGQGHIVRRRSSFGFTT